MVKERPPGVGTVMGEKDLSLEGINANRAKLPETLVSAVTVPYTRLTPDQATERTRILVIGTLFPIHEPVIREGLTYLTERIRDTKAPFDQKVRAAMLADIYAGQTTLPYGSRRLSSDIATAKQNVRFDRGKIGYSLAV
ncbi:MAG: hypothetical protein ACR2LN_02195 [Candidatus Levyibacteriota bacterium]